METTRIVIVGGGFGGVYTALHLEKLLRDRPEVEVVLISRDNYFLMTPLLFEAGSGVLEPRHAVTPIRPLLKRTRFIEAEIDEIDVAGRVVYAVHTPSAVGEPIPYELPYDQIVFALGGVTNRALIPGSGSAMAFKTLADAIRMRNHVIDLFEQAEVVTDPDRRRELLTFVVVGAGLVGVELMGELTEFVDNLLGTYTRIQRHEISFYLIEAGPRLLAEMDRDLADYAGAQLADRGVKLRIGVPVRAIEPRRVLTAEEAIDAATIVLAAGVSPSPLLADLPLAKDRKGRLAVEPTMRSAERPEVWALGDCAAIPAPDGRPYPPLAQHALREAKVLASNMVSALDDGPLSPFVYQNKGTLAALGHYAGVGKLTPFAGGGSLKITGLAAWWVWRTYYMLQMPRFERRLRLILDWTVALFFKNDVAKLDLYGEQPGEAAQSAGVEETRERGR